MHVNVWNSLKNLALLDLSSVINDVVNRRRLNVDADVQYVNFTRMCLIFLTDAVNSNLSRLTASARMLY